MDIIYKNEYGTVFNLEDSSTEPKKLLMRIDNVGLFMTIPEMNYLHDVIKNSDTPCFCDDCKGKKCDKIWCTNPMVDICLKVKGPGLEHLEDLILGTKFIINMDATLDEFRIQ